MKQKVSKKETTAQKCVFCGEEIMEVWKDPFYWLYEFARTRKRPEWKTWIHNYHDRNWCRITKATPLSSLLSPIDWKGWNLAKLTGNETRKLVFTNGEILQYCCGDLQEFQATQFGAVLLALREGKCHFCGAPVEVRNNAAD